MTPIEEPAAPANETRGQPVHLDVNNHEAFRTIVDVLNTLGIRTRQGEQYRQSRRGRVSLGQDNQREMSVWFMNQVRNAPDITNTIQDNIIIERATDGANLIYAHPTIAREWRDALNKANAGVEVVRVAFVYNNDPDNNWQRAWRFQGVYRLQSAASDPLPEQLVWELIAAQFEYQA